MTTMATSQSTPKSSTAKKPTTRKPAARKSPSTRSASTARTARSARTTRATAKGTTPAAARRSRTTAATKTREAATAEARAAKATAQETRHIAERAALTYVGATLEARDRVVGTVTDLVDRYGSVNAAEKELGRFERRGNTPAPRWSASCASRRRTVERLVRRNRNRVEHESEMAQRKAGRRPNVVTQQIDIVSNRVEDAVQVGVAVSERFAGKAREQVKTLV
jgi:hypothetical protein